MTEIQGLLILIGLLVIVILLEIARIISVHCMASRDTEALDPLARTRTLPTCPGAKNPFTRCPHDKPYTEREGHLGLWCADCGEIMEDADGKNPKEMWAAQYMGTFPSRPEDQELYERCIKYYRNKDRDDRETQYKAIGQWCTERHIPREHMQRTMRNALQQVDEEAACPPK